MQMVEAYQRWTHWRRTHLGETCEHPATTDEFYLGTRTGDRVCTTCFEAFWPAEKSAKGKTPTPV
jgi:hypothetical protein